MTGHIGPVIWSQWSACDCVLANIEVKRQIRSVFGSRIQCFTSALAHDLKHQKTLLPDFTLSLTASATDQRDLSEYGISPDPAENKSENDDSDPSKKGLIYARVSSQKQTKDSDESDGQADESDEELDEDSIDHQIAETRQLADEHGIELAHDPIIDEAQTGTDFDRDGIQKVFQLSQRSEVGYLFVQSVDRIGRSAAETLFFIHVLQSKCNVTLITSSGERNMNDVHGLMHTTLLSLMAEVQNEIRTTKAKKTRVRNFLEKKQWKSYSPVVPVGYELTDDGWLTNDPDELDNPSEIQAVKDLFETFIECENYAKTRRKINNEYDDVLDGHEIKTVLQNPVYIGKPKLPEEWVVDLPYDNELDEPQLKIIDDNIFNRVQEIIEEKDDKHSTDEDTFEMIDFIEKFDLFTVIAGSPAATLVHDCGTPMQKAGQRDLKGDMKTHLYHCPECDEHRRWPKQAEYDQMELIQWVMKQGSELIQRLR